MKSRTQYCAGLVGLLTAQGALGQTSESTPSGTVSPSTPVQPAQSNVQSEQAAPDAKATSPANPSDAVTNSGELASPASDVPPQSRAPTGTQSPSAGAITPSTPAEPAPVKGSGQLFIGVPVGFLAQRLQDEQGLSGSGWGIDIGLGFQYSWLNFVADFGFEHYKDKKEFRQTVIDSFGNVSEATSRVNLSYFAPAVGIKSPVVVVAPRVFAFTAAANVGYAFPFGTSREIVDCKDCRKESIHVKGGPFVEPALELLYPAEPRAQYGLAISWQKFFGDTDFNHKFAFRAVVMMQF